MPTVLQTDDTKAWHIYKETDEVNPVCKNYGPGTIHSYTKAKQKIDAKKPQPNPTQKINPNKPKPHPVSSSSEIWNGNFELMRFL